MISPHTTPAVRLCLAIVFALMAATPRAACSAERATIGPATRNASPRLLQSVQKELRAAEHAHADTLRTLAQDFSARGLTAEAERCRELSAGMSAAFVPSQELPKKVRGEPASSLPAQERVLRKALRKAEETFGSQLSLLSRKALRAGYPNYAYRLVQEILRHDPDQLFARKVLGYTLRGKTWVTPFAAKKLDDGFVWDERFGWLKKQSVAEYNAGRRYYRGAWRTADQEAEIRRDFRHAWEVQTDHYLVRTNHSLERGVEIAKELERFHDFFMQTFASFFHTSEQMRKLFQVAAAGGNLPLQRDPYEIYYFRTRDEYVQALKPKVPLIEITNGLYYTTDRIAYFYFDSNLQNQETLFHEATHQLFYETTKANRMIAMDANFWVVEGIACYMESYHAEEGPCTVGDPKQVRIAAARYRCVVDKYYIPLEPFSEMGMPAFQSSKEITKNYSQAAGLVHFFMHYDGGRYREALIEHLSEIYRAPRQRNAVKSLAELTGVPYAELDGQYVEYMKALPGSVTETATSDR